MPSQSKSKTWFHPLSRQQFLTHSSQPICWFSFHEHPLDGNDCISTDLEHLFWGKRITFVNDFASDKTSKCDKRSCSSGKCSSSFGFPSIQPHFLRLLKHELVAKARKWVLLFNFISYFRVQDLLTQNLLTISAKRPILGKSQGIVRQSRDIRTHWLVSLATSI